MKRNTLLTMALLAMLFWSAVSQRSDGQNRLLRIDTQVFMRQKLAWTESALQGLTLEKYDLISKSALRMRNMTQSNQWYVIKAPDYMARTTNFFKSVDALYMAGIDKNLDAALDAYTAVSRNCVDCHRHTRTEQRLQARDLK